MLLSFSSHERGAVTNRPCVGFWGLRECLTSILREIAIADEISVSIFALLNMLTYFLVVAFPPQALRAESRPKTSANDAI